MAETKKLKRVRIQSDGTHYNTIITTDDGQPVEGVVGAFWSCDVNSSFPHPLVALKFMDADLDVVADVATLTRLYAAEAVCREAARVLKALQREGLWPSVDRDAPRLGAFELRQALEEHRKAAGLPPLEDEEKEREAVVA